MKKIILLKYVLVLLLVVLSVAAVIFSPDIYEFTKMMNLGPCLALAGTGSATLIWDSVDD